MFIRNNLLVNSLLVILFLNESELIYLPTIKWFQVFLLIGWLFGFNGIPVFVGYLMPNPSFRRFP